MKLTVNGELREVDEAWTNETLLSVLRDGLGLIGAKLGCGVGQCGACTVIIDGEARRSCVEQAAELGSADILTIEGLAPSPGKLHPVQAAWIEESVPQCGYCQAGQIMSAVALLRANPRPSSKEVDQAMQGNLCRCGTYQRIRNAINSVAETL